MWLPNWTLPIECHDLGVRFGVIWNFVIQWTSTDRQRYLQYSAAFNPITLPQWSIQNKYIITIHTILKLLLKKDYNNYFAQFWLEVDSLTCPACFGMNCSESEKIQNLEDTPSGPSFMNSCPKPLPHLPQLTYKY